MQLGARYIKLGSKRLYFRILELYLLFGLFLSPFIFWPRAQLAYEIPRVWFISRWVEGLGVLGVFFAFKLLKKLQLETGIIKLVVVFALVSIVSSLVGVDTGKSVFGNYYRADGLITFFHLVGFFFFIALFWQKRWRESVALAISLGSIFVSLWTIVRGLRFYVFNDLSASMWGGPIAVSFGNANFLAGYLVVTVPFIWYLIVESKRLIYKRFCYVGLVVQIVAILFTRAWSGIFCILTFFCLLVLFNKKKSWRLLFLVIVGVFVVGQQMIVRRDLPEFPAAERRERIFRRIFLGVSRRPVLGYGWANVDYAFEAVDWPVYFEHDVYVDKAHSSILEVLATCGVLGLVLYLLLIVKTFMTLFIKLKNSNRESLNWYKVMIVAFVLFIFHSQTNIISIGEELMFWLVLGVAASRA
jgi:O-antigen ligase